MTTWTCKGTAAAIALSVLAACEDGQGAGFLQGLVPGGTAPPVALSQANMAFGAVTLVPPAGFCIDRGSLKQNFALMTRCEALGAPSSVAGTPFGIITASFSSASAIVPTPSDTAAALELEAVSDAIAREASVTFRAKGTPPADGLSDTHWRATALIGTQMMGLAFYGPVDGQAVSSEGRAILVSLITKLGGDV